MPAERKGEGELSRAVGTRWGGGGEVGGVGGQAAVKVGEG